ncbi:MAG: ABC transporter substrate-binding protein, partial [Candidatus Dormibacteraeota bacterium]|nr:ABC transporter substrate-binding protein [Candidatus Dormibacteraeota bacterium]
MILSGRCPGLVAAVISVLVVAGCNSAPPPLLGGGSVRPGGRVTAATAQEPDGFLSAGISDNQTAALAEVAPAMEGLLGRRPSSDLSRNPASTDYWEPQLATEIPTLENGGVRVRGEKMTVTWKLRAGVKWHDGTLFGADDVVDTFNFRWLRYGSKNPTRLAPAEGWNLVESVIMVDSHTVAVNFTSIYGPYLTLGSGPYGILPSHLLQKT